LITNTLKFKNITKGGVKKRKKEWKLKMNHTNPGSMHHEHTHTPSNTTFMCPRSIAGVPGASRLHCDLNWVDLKMRAFAPGGLQTWFLGPLCSRIHGTKRPKDNCRREHLKYVKLWVKIRLLKNWLNFSISYAATGRDLRQRLPPGGGVGKERRKGERACNIVFEVLAQVQLQKPKNGRAVATAATVPRPFCCQSSQKWGAQCLEMNFWEWYTSDHDVFLAGTPNA